MGTPVIENKEDFEQLCEVARKAEFSTPPLRSLPENLEGRYVRPETAIAEAHSDINVPMSVPKKKKKNVRRTRSHTKRVMQELTSIASKRGAHPSIHVFPSDELYLWQVLLEGPDNTPYQGGVFVLYVNFPPKYPDVPPEVRFLTKIYHCNINNSGRICHSVFDRDYVSTLKVNFILQCVFGLLVFPAPEDPLDSVLASEFLQTPETYNANARACTKKHAKKFTLRQLKQKMLGDDFIETEKQVIFTGVDFTTVEIAKKPKKIQSTSTFLNDDDDDDDDEPPMHLLCSITSALFKDPVVNKHGSTYERSAIEAHLKRHNTDPLTGQPLTL